MGPRLRAKMTCHISLHAYPVDDQECEIRILSYAHPERELLLHWRDVTPYTPRVEVSKALV